MIVLVLAVLLLWAQCERHSGRNLCSPYFVNEGECVELTLVEELLGLLAQLPGHAASTRWSW